MIFAVPGPIRGDVSGITDREQMKIRRIPYSIGSLKCSGLLPGNSVRVDRIYDGKIIALSKLAHEIPARAAYAAADAEVFPVEAQTSVLAPCSSALETATVMPRSLNEPVGLTPSFFTKTSQPRPTRLLSCGQ